MTLGRSLTISKDRSGPITDTSGSPLLILVSCDNALAYNNPRYSWVTYFILSNICNFSQLVWSILSTHPLLTLSILSPYQSFVVLSNVCHLLDPCYLFTFYVIISLYKCTCSTPHTTQYFLLSYRAHALCGNIPFLLTRRLCPLCHSDYGGNGPWLFCSVYIYLFSLGQHAHRLIRTFAPFHHSKGLLSRSVFMA